MGKSALVCNIAENAAVEHGKPVALPTLHARERHTIFLHGSPSNEVLKSVKSAGLASTVATLKARFVIKDGDKADD